MNTVQLSVEQQRALDRIEQEYSSFKEVRKYLAALVEVVPNNYDLGAYLRSNVLEKEQCVLCGEHTLYDKNANIDLRNNYVESAGQLCKKCYLKVYTQ